MQHGWINVCWLNERNTAALSLSSVSLPSGALSLGQNSWVNSDPNPLPSAKPHHIYFRFGISAHFISPARTSWLPHSCFLGSSNDSIFAVHQTYSDQSEPRSESHSAHNSPWHSHQQSDIHLHAVFQNIPKMTSSLSSWLWAVLSAILWFLSLICTICIFTSAASHHKRFFSGSVFQVQQHDGQQSML